MYVLPNGDVLVSETNAPPGSSGYTGIKAWFFKRFKAKAGGAVPSANRITLLRDGDGVAETRTVFLNNLHSPFGMALVGNVLYVANSDALVRFPYADGATQITASATKVADFPPGPTNHHWTKSLIANADGTKLYAGVGSNSNAAKNGMEKEQERAVPRQRRGVDRSTHRSPRQPLSHPTTRSGHTRDPWDLRIRKALR